MAVLGSAPCIMPAARAGLDATSLGTQDVDAARRQSTPIPTADNATLLLAGYCR
jgi:hypothetical protein